MNIHYLGIRHHGPGSARNLIDALNSIKPDAVLLEMPADVRDALEAIGTKAIQPPVALLIYNPDSPTQASFYPFAEFSPEWQAVLYCKKNLVHLRCFDLPKSNWLALSAEESIATTENVEKEALQIRQDPLGYIGSLAGYEDGERWWDNLIEKQGSHEQTFRAIQEVMTALRTELALPESGETLLREAKMRQTIREAAKDLYENIVVVCGAWHIPALTDYAKTEKEDEKQLKKLKKVKVEFTWIPWTYERLATSSGYGAGVISPAWYEILFKVKREKVLTQWMTRAARLLRAQGIDASAAHVIEAVRLTYALAAIRGQNLPGLEEMLEAATSIFGGGYPEPIQIIHKELIVGNKMGGVSATQNNSPLKRDFELHLKKLKLSKYWGRQEKQELELDVRNPVNLEKNRFLYRIKLLGIKWADKNKYAKKSQNARITYELWVFKWKPEMEIAMLEAGVWGNTILEAVTNKNANLIRSSDSLEALTAIFKDSLKADLPELNKTLLRKIRNLATASKDIFALISILPELVEISRYTATDLHKTDVSIVRDLIDEIIPRLCISLPYLCSMLDSEASTDMWNRMREAYQAIRTYNHQAHLKDFHDALSKIIAFNNIDGLIVGGSVRILSDFGINDIEKTRQLLSYSLSLGIDTQYVMRWLDGFLMDSVTILLFNPDILTIIDNWLISLKETLFMEYVALIRRVFSRFSVPERQKILNLLMTEKRTQEAPTRTASAEILLNAENVASIQKAFTEWIDFIYLKN